MSGFTPAERVDVDIYFKTLVKSLHQLDEQHPARLRAILAKAEAAPTDPTLARAMVATEILRGISAGARSPVTIRDYALPGGLSAALAEAQQFGRQLTPFVTGTRGGLFGKFFAPKKQLDQAGREALMRCRAIGATLDRRAAGTRSGRSVRTR